MGFKINWMSTSTWAGTKKVEYEGDDTYETREDAEKALHDMELDDDLMTEVQSAAIEGQGVEGWLEIEEE